MKPYLMIFNSIALPRQTLLNYLDTRPEVLNWYAFLDTGVFIISTHTAYQLSELIRQHFPGVYFVVTEVPSGSNDGWLPKAAWDFINNPRRPG